MFSFKYRPNEMANMRKVTVPDAFTRLGYSAAYYSLNAFHDTEHEEHVFSLWSYETLIIVVIISFDYRISHMHITIDVNRDSYDCSNTTRRHISRFFSWLRIRYGLSVGISYGACKGAIEYAARDSGIAFDSTSQTYTDACKRDVPITWVALSEHNIMRLNRTFELSTPISETL